MVTVDTLRRCGYTGEIYIVIDNEDKTADEYRKKFGDRWVIEFDKAAIEKTFDVADTGKDRRSIVFARNASFEIAKDLGLDYFLQLDDDYTSFMFRWQEGDTLLSCETRQMNKVIDAMIDFLDTSGAATVAMAQGGDFIGGIEGTAIRKPLLRKAMNSFMFRTDSDTRFVGRINEDVNTYVVEGSRGKLFLTTTAIMLTQKPTQQHAGGMTEIYLEVGTYYKSFYTVMMAPSCVTIRQMGPTNPRLHHNIRWDSAVPKILSDRYRKTKEAKTNA